jgi:hypothetical protein
MATTTPISPVPSHKATPYIPYREAYPKNSESLHRLQDEYGRALKEALNGLAVGGLQAYAQRLQIFLQYLRTSHEISNPSVSAYNVMVMCMLGQYNTARQLLRTTSPKLDGISETNIAENVPTRVTVMAQRVSHSPRAATPATPAPAFDRRQSAPPTTQSSTVSSPIGTPLVAVHSVDSAALKQMPAYNAAPVHRQSSPNQLDPRSLPPPPPYRSPRNSISSLPPPTPQDGLSPRPLSMAGYETKTDYFGAYSPAQYSNSVIKRRPVGVASGRPQPLPTPPYSPPQFTPTASPLTPQQNANLQFPPPPSAPAPKSAGAHPASVQNVSHPRSQSVSPQNLHPNAHNQVMQQPQRQVQRPPGARNAPTAQRGAPQSTRGGRGRSAPPTAKAPSHVTAVGPDCREGFTGPPIAKPKESKKEKLKKFSKSPAGRIAMRVGTGVVIASLTGGLLAGGGEDLFGGGGEDIGADLGGDFEGGDMGGDAFGGEDFAGDGYDFGGAEAGGEDYAGTFEDQGYADGTGEYATFEDQIVYEDQGAGYGEEYGTFEEQYVTENGYVDSAPTLEDQALAESGDMGYTEGAPTFEDNGVTDAGYSEQYDGGVDTTYEEPAAGTGEVATSDLPGQVGPCFEDNIILSAAAG